MALLVEQALQYISSEKVSVVALSKAKFHRKEAAFGEPLYIRQYGGNSLLDQMTLTFHPADDLFDRTMSLSISVRGLTEDDLRVRVLENLHNHGFTLGDTRDTGFMVCSDGKAEIEVFIHMAELNALVSIRKPRDL